MKLWLTTSRSGIKLLKNNMLSLALNFSGNSFKGSNSCHLKLSKLFGSRFIHLNLYKPKIQSSSKTGGHHRGRGLWQFIHDRKQFTWIHKGFSRNYFQTMSVSPREDKLCSHHLSHPIFPFQSWGAGPGRSHDPGGGHPVLPGSRDTARRQTLHQLHRHLVSRMHLRGTAGQADTVPGRRGAVQWQYWYWGLNLKQQLLESVINESGLLWVLLNY